MTRKRKNVQSSRQLASSENDGVVSKKTITLFRNGKLHGNGYSKSITSSGTNLRASKHDDSSSVRLEIEDFIFPSWTPWVVFAIVLVFRVAYVSQSKNWWILHPDEVFQSVEVAFSELNGYGFRAYEYLPPPNGNFTSHARKQEADLGMHSLRSFLYPRVFMIVMLVGDWFGVRPFLISKVFHATICSLLPLVSYFFTARVFRSHDVASLTSVLVGFSVHLTVFGTHTLVNSFLAPLVLFALVPIVQRLLSEGEDIDKYADISSSNTVHERTETVPNSANVGELPHARSHELNPAQRSATLRLFLSGLALGIACYIRIDLTLFLFILISPLCLRTRFKQVTLTLDLQILFPVLTGFTSGMIIGGFDDKLSYGVWFLSPCQWLRFNVGFDFATLLFGKQDLDYYVKRIIFHNTSYFSLFVILISVLLISLFSSNFIQNYQKTLGKILKLSVSSVLLLSIYSLKGHKEDRFLHNFLVLLIMVYSSAAILLVNYVISRGWTRRHVKASVIVWVTLYFLNQWYVFPSPVDQSNKSWVYNSGWDSNHVNECFDYVSERPDVSGVFVDRSIHTSAAFSVLRKDVPLLALVHYELYEFGPDAYLPLVPLTYLARKDVIRARTLTSISNYISIYNSHEYLLKTILSNKEYNYLIMTSEKVFIQQGYEQVFKSGTMKVLRRTFDKNAEKYLEKVANGLPIGSNATILEYEGSWLLTFGLFKLAEERLLTALQMGNPSVRLFQILVNVFLEQNKNSNARKAEQLCVNTWGVEKCRTPQPRVVLHKEYDIDLPTSKH